MLLIKNLPILSCRFTLHIVTRFHEFLVFVIRYRPITGDRIDVDRLSPRHRPKLGPNTTFRIVVKPQFQIRFFSPTPWHPRPTEWPVIRLRQAIIMIPCKPNSPRIRAFPVKPFDRPHHRQTGLKVPSLQVPSLISFSWFSP